MAENQVVKVFFASNLTRTDLSYTFYDASGILSNGPLPTSTDRLVFNVTVGSPSDKTYHLRIVDVDGAIVNHKMHHSEGGIVIIDNVDIGQTNIVTNSERQLLEKEAISPAKKRL